MSCSVNAKIFHVVKFKNTNFFLNQSP
jgi:hypothetical protein